MDIKKKNCQLLLLLVVIGLSCKKQPQSCSMFGYEFTNSKPGVFYYPGVDSFSLGNQITLEASVPKTFFEEEKRYNVTLNENEILGPFSVQKATNDPIIPRIGAIDDLELIAITGSLVKDTIQFSQGILKGFRTVHWVNLSDSFKLKFIIKPKIKGIFFVGLGQQGNRDADCALYKYFVKVKGQDQHLYLLEQVDGTSNIQNDYTYCFKVY